MGLFRSASVAALLRFPACRAARSRRGCVRRSKAIPEKLQLLPRRKRQRRTRPRSEHGQVALGRLRRRHPQEHPARHTRNADARVPMAVGRRRADCRLSALAARAARPTRHSRAIRPPDESSSSDRRNAASATCSTAAADGWGPTSARFASSAKRAELQEAIVEPGQVAAPELRDRGSAAAFRTAFCAARRRTRTPSPSRSWMSKKSCTCSSSRNVERNQDAAQIADAGDRHDRSRTRQRDRLPEEPRARDPAPPEWKPAADLNVTYSRLKNASRRAAELAHLLGRLPGNALQPARLHHAGQREHAQRAVVLSIRRRQQRDRAHRGGRADVRHRPAE